jgi:ubiquinone/menaquinone biosynthesis C-methylase UbiE
MEDKIELLEAGLLNDKNKLQAIDHWLDVMNWPNGWHYDLDIVWILQHIEKLGLPKGATIIDAGAGLGVTQFILASCGYNVISLDFTSRKVPRFSKGIFMIENIERDLGSYTHEYMEFMKYDQEQASKSRKSRTPFSLMQKAFDLKRLNLNVYKGRVLFKKVFNLSYLSESMKDHKGFGKITFLRGTFNSIPLKDSIADALVSVSAFEHNTYKDIPGSVNEFMRVIKKGAPLLITTSAAEKEDWYFKSPKAWNFTRGSLSGWFGISDDRIIFNYRDAFEKITRSRELEGRISSFYKFNGENGLPFGDLKKAKYLPVGIVKVKKE